jgi:transcription elongation factor GreA
MKYPVTREGLTKLENELKELSGPKMKEVVQLLELAKERGDLSENPEYEAARNLWEGYQIRISQLRDLIHRSHIIDIEQVSLERVQILTSVTVKNTKTDFLQKFDIVPENEIDTKRQKISFKSPIACGLIGKVVGELSHISTPGGSIELEIVSIDHIDKER